MPLTLEPQEVKQRALARSAEVRPAQPLLSARGLSVRYPRCTECSLDEVTLGVSEGERVALVGPSGGGKTTLLRALEGSVKPTAGEVTREGRAVLVYQDLRLVAEQSVLANICSGAFGEIGYFSGIFAFPKEICRRAKELLNDLGLGRLADRKVGSLSGGQRQRVAIARALCSRPRVLLADEPLASLDPRNARRTLELLACLQKKYNFALVISTHHPNLLPGFFTRYLAVHDGKVDAASEAYIQNHHTFQRIDACIPSFEPEMTPAEDVPQDRSIHKNPKIARRVRRSIIGVIILAALVWSVTALQLRGSSFAGALGGLLTFLKGTIPASWAQVFELPWGRFTQSLLQTIQMAVVGTFIGIVVSLPLSVLAARQTGPRYLRGAVRLLLNAIRTVPSIYWALLFIACVGLGPIAGVFALGCYSIGYLTKFFYEALEDVDAKPASALRALGGSPLQTFLWAVFPAARPALIGSCLFVLEYNVRGASVLGVVGAGGIGQDLMYYFEWRQFPEAAAGLLMILVVVIGLDALSQWWRRHLTRQRGE